MHAVTYLCSIGINPLVARPFLMLSNPVLGTQVPNPQPFQQGGKHFTGKWKRFKRASIRQLSGKPGNQFSLHGLYMYCDLLAGNQSCEFFRDK